MNFEFTPAVKPPVIRRIAREAFEATRTREELILATFKTSQKFRAHMVQGNIKDIDLLIFFESLDSVGVDVFHAPDWFDLNCDDDMAAWRLAQYAHRFGAGMLIAEHLTCRGHGYCEKIAQPCKTDFHQRAHIAVRALISNCTDVEKALRSPEVVQANRQLADLIKVLVACVQNEILSNIGQATSWSSMAHEHANWDYWTQPQNAWIGFTLSNVEEPKKPPHWHLIDMVVAVQSLEPPT
jgi:hypothetical protein